MLTAARSAEDRVLAAQQRRTAARDELLSETIFRESGALLRGRSNQDMKKAAAAALGEDRVEAARARREAELTKLVEETHEREEAARQRREAALDEKRAAGKGIVDGTLPPSAAAPWCYCSPCWCRC